MIAIAHFIAVTFYLAAPTPPPLAGFTREPGASLTGLGPGASEIDNG